MSSTADTPRRYAPARPARAPRHSRLTRLSHAALVLAVIVQLASSLIMRRPYGGNPGNGFFQIHEYAGLVAMAIIVVFWLNVIGRRLGTAPAALMPWFSAERRRALHADILRHIEAAKRLRLPEHDERAALPSAIHGMGLLLMTYMAASGTVWYAMTANGLGHVAFVRPMMEIHGAFGNLVWVYLLGHAALGVLQHVTSSQPLSVMWSARD